MAATCFGSLRANAQLNVLSGNNVQSVFSGIGRQIVVSLSNSSVCPVEVKARTRLFQTSSATAALVVEAPWKNFQILPGQSIAESVNLDFPAVKAETRFVIQWIEGASNVVGRTEVFVYPTNLLARLKTLAGDEPVGVFDPANQLKPLLGSMAVEFQDLIEDGTDKLRGKLAIFGPFKSKSQMRASLKDDVRVLAKRGVAVVWLLPPPEKHVPLKPSFYTVRDDAGAVVVVAHDVVTQLAERPEAQLNLLRLAEEALHPTPLSLPETETSN